MSLHDKIDLRVACIQVLAAIPVLIFVVIWITKLQPLTKNFELVEEYVESIEGDWKELQKEHPPYADFKITIPSRPMLTISEKVEEDLNMAPLEQFFIDRRPPQPLVVTVTVMKGEEVSASYFWRYPDMAEGKWDIMDALPTED